MAGICPFTAVAHSMTAAARWQQRGGCSGGGNATERRRRQHGRGAVATATRSAAAAHSATVAARWLQCAGCGRGGSATARRRRQKMAARRQCQPQRRSAVRWRDVGSGGSAYVRRRRKLGGCSPVMVSLFYVSFFCCFLPLFFLRGPISTSFFKSKSFPDVSEATMNPLSKSSAAR